MRKSVTEALRAAALVVVAAIGLTSGVVMAAEGAAAPAGAAPAAAPAAAPLPAPADDDWHLTSRTGIWLMGIDGTLGGKNVNFDVSLDYSEVSDYLDYNIMPDYELTKGNWVFVGNGQITKFTNDDAVLGLDVERKFYIYGANFGVGYTLVRTTVGDMPLTITPLVGFQYTGLSASVKVGHEDSHTAWRDWVDATAGAIVNLKINEDWDWTTSGNIGTGDYWGGSDLVYTAQTMLDWNFSKKWSLTAGYRVQYWYYNQSDLKWDMTFNGPWIGFTSKWF